MCCAQNSPQDYVDVHNVARAAVGVGNIQWDDNIAAYAQQYANQRIGDCVLQHSGGSYGENIAGGGNGGYELSGTDAVNMWVNEGVNYDHGSNTCSPGQVCGHYTQVVWRDSVRLGCARVICNSSGIFVICNYDPPGNIIGSSPY
ncbi:hypothetical protein SOVF_131020 [Spinacia oleracea]|nr:hypothetical protein SOVF_131020 [Spinacia oleracea]